MSPSVFLSLDENTDLWNHLSETGSVEWETRCEDVFVSLQSDLWSLGITAIEMAEGAPRKCDFIPTNWKSAQFVLLAFKSALVLFNFSSFHYFSFLFFPTFPLLLQFFNHTFSFFSLNYLIFFLLLFTFLLLTHLPFLYTFQLFLYYPSFIFPYCYFL